MPDLREQVREWLIDARYGVIDQTRLIARADQAIADLAEPPDYLFAISLGEALDNVPRLDLRAETIAQNDLAKLARRLLDGLQTECLSLEHIAAVASRIEFPTGDEAQDTWRHLSWIADEAGLIDQGVKDPSTFRDGVIAALQRATDGNDD